MNKDNIKTDALGLAEEASNALHQARAMVFIAKIVFEFPEEYFEKPSFKQDLEVTH
jgi:hypothetical protein